MNKKIKSCSNKERDWFDRIFRSLCKSQLLMWTSRFQTPLWPLVTVTEDSYFSDFHFLPCPLHYSGNIEGLAFSLDEGQQINKVKCLRHLNCHPWYISSVTSTVTSFYSSGGPLISSSLCKLMQNCSSSITCYSFQTPNGMGYFLIWQMERTEWQCAELQVNRIVVQPGMQSAGKESMVLFSGLLNQRFIYIYFVLMYKSL